MRTSYVLAALAVLSILPAGADAQQSDRDRRDRERRDRERREEERRDREQERREMEQERRERERERVRARERVTVRVYRDGDQFRRRPPSRNLSLMVGVLNYDFADDDNFPMAALRADWRLTRWLRSEVDVAYALGSVNPPLSPSPAPSDDDRSSSLGAATVGIQAELPIPYVRPYAGVAVGLFGRSDEGDDGASFVRPTTAFPVGVRVALSRRLALRGEVRFRYDQHEDNTTARDVERTVGLSFGF